MTTISEISQNGSTCCRPQWLENTVTWIRADRALPYKVAVYALAFFASLVLTASLVGIPLVVLAVREWMVQSSTPPASLLQDSPIPWKEIKAQTDLRERELSLECREPNRSYDRWRDIRPYPYNSWKETNGSCISFPFKGTTMPANPQYVAMCAPIPHSAAKIISLYSAQKIPLVLTLTPFEYQKAEAYMPQNQGETLDCGDSLTIRCDKTKDVTFGDFHGAERRYSLHQACKEVHTFTEIQIIDWADMTGGNAKSILALSDHADKFRKSDIPIVVCCSAGVGRTGTFILSEQIKQHVKRSEPFKVNGLFSDLRMQRQGSVQKQEQYATLFEVADILTRI